MALESMVERDSEKSSSEPEREPKLEWREGARSPSPTEGVRVYEVVPGILCVCYQRTIEPWIWAEGKDEP
jgi:hypothetical protein